MSISSAALLAYILGASHRIVEILGINPDAATTLSKKGSYAEWMGAQECENGRPLQLFRQHSAGRLEYRSQQHCVPRARATTLPQSSIAVAGPSYGQVSILEDEADASVGVRKRTQRLPSPR